MKKIVIVGAGRHGMELYSYLIDPAGGLGVAEFAGFADDSQPHDDFVRTRLLGRIEDLPAHLAEDAGADYGYIAAAGDNRIRREFVRRIESLHIPNLSPWTLRHQHTSVGREVEIGAGTCLAPGAILTTYIRIGRHAILNVNSSVSHDCVLGDYVNVNPGATVCGNVRVGEGAFIGTGAVVKNNVSVGEWSLIGAGAVVIRDIPAHVTAFGVPARVTKRDEGAA